MFEDIRSKKLILVAHCLLNQNSISDGTALYPGSIAEIVNFLIKSSIGIVQMPCPELLCLGLDRGNINGSKVPVVLENTRIRSMMNKKQAAVRLKHLVKDLVFQISEYQKYGFEVKGVIGVNRSPSCGVDTTSMKNLEVQGEGVFMKMLRDEIVRKKINLKFLGIRVSESQQSLRSVRRLLG
jgi:predicted secreted protein